jgi:hypothetical protein
LRSIASMRGIMAGERALGAALAEYVEAHATSLIYVGRPLSMRDGKNDAG